MKILAIYDKSGPKYHRILLPVHGMQQSGAEAWVKFHLQESDFETDIVFYNRHIPTIELKELLEKRAKYGFKLICDLDDHWLLGSDHILHEHYKQHEVPKKIENNIKAADAVTVTHERLRELVLPLNKNVHVFPNAIPRIDQFDIDRAPDKDIRLFWAGSVTHLNDLRLLEKVMPRIKREGVKFIIAGYNQADIVWKKMAKIFTANSSFNTKVLNHLPVSEYYSFYRLCDVSLIPLVDNDFNRHKSNLKILEAANIGATVIVSRVHPYLDFPEHVVNYVDMHSPWYSQINKILKDATLRRDQGLMLKAYCDHHFNFDKINAERKQLFESL